MAVRPKAWTSDKDEISKESWLEKEDLILGRNVSSADTIWILVLCFSCHGKLTVTEHSFWKQWKLREKEENRAIGPLF